jgi:hypothetical protein
VRRIIVLAVMRSAPEVTALVAGAGWGFRQPLAEFNREIRVTRSSGISTFEPMQGGEP